MAARIHILEEPNCSSTTRGKGKGKFLDCLGLTKHRDRLELLCAGRLKDEESRMKGFQTQE